MSNKGTASEYYQAKYCSALAPTAAPTGSPTGPSYEPTPQPTSPSNKPTPQPTTPRPTGLPTVAGAINTGYIVKTTYSDYYTCSTVSSVSLYRLGACIVSSTTSSYKYLNYDANTFASMGYVQVVHVAYSDGSCGTVSSHYKNTWGSSSCSYDATAAYSSSLPALPRAPGVITA